MLSKSLKTLSLIVATALGLSLTGCLEWKGVELSSDDLVQPEGIEGRWVVTKFFDSKDPMELAQIRSVGDGTFEISMIKPDPDEGADSVSRWSLSLVETASERVMIGVPGIHGDKLDKVMGKGVGYFVRGGIDDATKDSEWTFLLLQVARGVSDSQVAQLVGAHGLAYKKTGSKASIEGRITADTLRAILGDSRALEYFAALKYGLTRIPQDHPYQRWLDQALGKRAQAPTAGEEKAPARTLQRRSRRPGRSDAWRIIRREASACFIRS